MLPRVKNLRKLDRFRRVRRPPASEAISCTGCKQVIVLPDGACYCGVWKEKVSNLLCKSCPYYDQETLEYKLFRRE